MKKNEQHENKKKLHNSWSQRKKTIIQHFMKSSI